MLVGFMMNLNETNSFPWAPNDLSFGACTPPQGENDRVAVVCFRPTATVDGFILCTSEPCRSQAISLYGLNFHKVRSVGYFRTKSLILRFNFQLSERLEGLHFEKASTFNSFTAYPAIFLGLAIAQEVLHIINLVFV